MGIILLAAVFFFIFIFIAYAIVWRISDWENIDKYNQLFYKNGYHTYYDREIIREIERCKF